MFGAAFYLTLMWALVADCIDYQEQKTGRREESSIYATYSLFRKIAQGVGAAVVSYAIGATGYNQNLGALEQAPGVPEKIYFVTAFLPFIGAIISFLSMLFCILLTITHRKTAKTVKIKKKKHKSDFIISTEESYARSNKYKQKLAFFKKRAACA